MYQSKKCPPLPTIYLENYPTLDQAIDDFNQKIYRETATRWYKKRYGYHEKPSTLNRKRKKMKRLLSQRQNRMGALSTPNNTLWLKIDSTEQFSRTGKNAVGH